MIWLILSISLIVRFIMLFVPKMLWWDGAIYVDMGKYIFSHGAIGFWESFRPIIWPAVLGIFWKLGLNAYNWGIYLQIVCSLIAIYIVYKIAESLREHSGVYAAVVFSFTPIFLGFTIVPLTDIPAMLLALVAVYYCSKESFVVSGIFLSLAFLFRFPLALLVLPLGIIVLLKIIREKNWKPLIKIVAGTLPLILIYFAINFALYGNILKPILDGSSVAAASLGAHYKEVSYYILFGFAENPLLIFSLVFMYFGLRNYKATAKNSTALLVLTSGIILLGYFTYFPHKELRYSIAFLPYFAIMAGVGMEMVIAKLPTSVARPTAIICSTVFLFLISYGVLTTTVPRQGTSPERTAYLDYFTSTPGAHIITSSPQLAVDADVSLDRVNGVWEDLADLYNYSEKPFDYVAIDSCEMACSTNECDARKAAFISTILETNSLVLSKTDQNGCNLTIYKHY